MRESNSNVSKPLVGAIYDGIICLKPPESEILIHIRFNIATVTKNVLKVYVHGFEHFT